MALNFLREDQHVEERRRLARLTRPSTKLTKSTNHKTHQDSSTTRTCLCCCDTLFHPAYQILPCGDSVCLRCLEQMIIPSIKEEAKLPPRCCGIPMSSGTIAAALSQEQLQQFLQAVYIAITPVLCRVWCPKPSCSAFTAVDVDLVQRHTTISCWACDTAICTWCKQYGHGSTQRCAANLEPPAVLNMIYKYGWRQCIRCHCLLELKEGCRQVQCSCGANFCYVCMEPGQCRKACSLAKLDRYRHQAEVARKRDADYLAEKDAKMAKQVDQHPELADLEAKAYAELVRFYDYHQRKLSEMHTRHELYMSQTLASSGLSTHGRSLSEENNTNPTTYLETVISRHQRILASIEDVHVQQEAQLLQQQATKELKLHQHISRLQHHWDTMLPKSRRHKHDLSEQLDRLARLQNRHALEIKSLRESQQRMQDDLSERFNSEIRIAVETQRHREKRAANMIAREESIFDTAFQRRLHDVWKLWGLRWDETRLQLRRAAEKHAVRGDVEAFSIRWRPSWLSDGKSIPAVKFLVEQLNSVLVGFYGKEAVDRWAGIGPTKGEGTDDASVWEWEVDGDDEEELDYHDFVRPWKKSKKEKKIDLGGPLIWAISG